MIGAMFGGRNRNGISSLIIEDLGISRVGFQRLILQKFLSIMLMAGIR